MNDSMPEFHVPHAVPYVASKLPVLQEDLLHARSLLSEAEATIAAQADCIRCLMAALDVERARG